MVEVEYRRIIWSFKNRPHIYVFDEKFLWIWDSLFALWFWDFARYVCIMQIENSATNIHTYYRQSETAPIYARYMWEKFRPDIYKNCGAFEIGGRLIERWYLGVCLCHVLYMRSSFGWGRFCWLVDVKFWL